MSVSCRREPHFGIIWDDANYAKYQEIVFRVGEKLIFTLFLHDFGTKKTQIAVSCRREAHFEPLWAPRKTTQLRPET